MPCTSDNCLTTPLILAGSTNSGFKATSTDAGKMFSSKSASLSIPKLFLASFAADPE